MTPAERQAIKEFYVDTAYLETLPACFSHTKLRAHDSCCIHYVDSSHPHAGLLGCSEKYMEKFRVCFAELPAEVMEAIECEHSAFFLNRVL